MKRADVNRLAIESGLYSGAVSVSALLDRFAALVAAAEREACAEVAENENNFDSTECGADVANDIAAAIRARGQESEL